MRRTDSSKKFGIADSFVDFIITYSHIQRFSHFSFETQCYGCKKIEKTVKYF